MTTETPDQSVGDGPEPDQDRSPSPWHQTFQSIVAGNAMVAFLSVLLAVLVGSFLIAATDDAVRESAGYILARPGDFFTAVWEAVWGAYTALFRGAIYNPRVDTLAGQLRPLTESLKFAAPLIAAGLGVGLAFRAAMFNIGGRGQMLLAGAAAGWVGFTLDLPAISFDLLGLTVNVAAIIHVTLAIVAGMVAGGLWGGIAGFLKARTGAHEVIVTIMLNYVAYYLILFALARPWLLQAPGSNNPKSLPMKEDARLPKILGDQFNLHLGIVLSLIAVGLVWWILQRSALGFRIRAVGLNPDAARAAGINVGRTYTTVMLLAGGLVGLAGVNQVLGTVTSGVVGDLDAGIGFDAITVALLGRSRPLGILGAGLLFGAFKAGSFSMQASQNIPTDIVLVVQSLIVLFIAAPPLIRTIFRLPAKEEA